MSITNFPIAYSPCPNDTYLFYAWQAGLIPNAPLINPTLADIQQLNQWMEARSFPIMKASFFRWAKSLDDYILLPTGTALGYACGPKIIASKPFPLEELVHKRIAIPGVDTTAHFLLQILCPAPLEKIYCTYDKIGQTIAEGKADCGLIIHESRFTFSEAGFIEITDLGQLWENEYKLPIPLGGIFALRSLSKESTQNAIMAIQASLTYARNHPLMTHPYIFQHSQEKDLDVVRQHIDLYVTDETFQLSENGKKSISTLLQAAESRGIIAQKSLPWLFEDQTCNAC